MLKKLAQYGIKCIYCRILSHMKLAKEDCQRKENKALFYVHTVEMLGIMKIIATLNRWNVSLAISRTTLRKTAPEWPHNGYLNQLFQRS